MEVLAIETICASQPLHVSVIDPQCWFYHTGMSPTLCHQIAWQSVLLKYNGHAI